MSPIVVGTIPLKPVDVPRVEGCQETITKNLTTKFFICKYAAKFMNDGAVLLLSSSAAQIGLPNYKDIALAKDGVEGLAHS